MASIAVLRINLRAQVLLVVSFVFFYTTTTDGKFVYRYNPMGGELKYLPNSPPYWDDSVLERFNQVRGQDFDYKCTFMLFR